MIAIYVTLIDITFKTSNIHMSTIFKIRINRIHERRTNSAWTVLFASSAKLGDIAEIVFTQTQTWSLNGKILEIFAHRRTIMGGVYHCIKLGVVHRVLSDITVVEASFVHKILRSRHKRYQPE